MADEIPEEYEVNPRKMKEGLSEALKHQLNLVGDAVEFGLEQQIDPRINAYFSLRTAAIRVDMNVKEYDARLVTYTEIRKNKLKKKKENGR